MKKYKKSNNSDRKNSDWESSYPRAMSYVNSMFGIVLKKEEGVMWGGKG